MVKDNRAPGFHEVNSFLKSSKSNDRSIRPFLSGVKQVGDTTVVASLEQQYTKSTGIYLRTGRLTKQRAERKTTASTKQMDSQKQQSFPSTGDMKTRSSEVRIKQEKINEALEQTEVNKSSLTQQKLSETEFIEILDIRDSETILSKNMNELDTSTDGETSFGTSKRPWEALGSRKKPKKHYYADVNALNDKLQQLDTDMESEGEDSPQKSNSLGEQLSNTKTNSISARADREMCTSMDEENPSQDLEIENIWND